MEDDLRDLSMFDLPPLDQFEHVDDQFHNTQDQMAYQTQEYDCSINQDLTFADSDVRLMCGYPFGQFDQTEAEVDELVQRIKHDTARKERDKFDVDSISAASDPGKCSSYSTSPMSARINYLDMAFSSMDDSPVRHSQAILDGVMSLSDSNSADMFSLQSDRRANMLEDIEQPPMEEEIVLEEESIDSNHILDLDTSCIVENQMHQNRFAAMQEQMGGMMFPSFPTPMQYASFPSVYNMSPNYPRSYAYTQGPTFPSQVTMNDAMISTCSSQPTMSHMNRFVPSPVQTAGSICHQAPVFSKVKNKKKVKLAKEQQRLLEYGASWAYVPLTRTLPPLLPKPVFGMGSSPYDSISCAPSSSGKTLMVSNAASATYTSAIATNNATNVCLQSSPPREVPLVDLSEVDDHPGSSVVTSAVVTFSEVVNNTSTSIPIQKSFPVLATTKPTTSIRELSKQQLKCPPCKPSSGMVALREALSSKNPLKIAYQAQKQKNSNPEQNKDPVEIPVLSTPMSFTAVSSTQSSSYTTTATTITSTTTSVFSSLSSESVDIRKTEELSQPAVDRTSLSIRSGPESEKNVPAAPACSVQTKKKLPMPLVENFLHTSLLSYRRQLFKDSVPNPPLISPVKVAETCGVGVQTSPMKLPLTNVINSCQEEAQTEMKFTISEIVRNVFTYNRLLKNSTMAANSDDNAVLDTSRMTGMPVEKVRESIGLKPERTPQGIIDTSACSPQLNDLKENRELTPVAPVCGEQKSRYDRYHRKRSSSNGRFMKTNVNTESSSGKPRGKRAVTTTDNNTKRRLFGESQRKMTLSVRSTMQELVNSVVLEMSPPFKKRRTCRVDNYDLTPRRVRTRGNVANVIV